MERARISSFDFEGPCNFPWRIGWKPEVGIRRRQSETEAPLISLHLKMRERHPLKSRIWLSDYLLVGWPFFRVAFINVYPYYVITHIGNDFAIASGIYYGDYAPTI